MVLEILILSGLDFISNMDFLKGFTFGAACVFLYRGWHSRQSGDRRCLVLCLQRDIIVSKLVSIGNYASLGDGLSVSEQICLILEL